MKGSGPGQSNDARLTGGRGEALRHAGSPQDRSMYSLCRVARYLSCSAGVVPVNVPGCAAGDTGVGCWSTPGGYMLTLFEGVLLVCLVSMIVYWRLSLRKGTGKKDLEERVVALERQQKELRNAIALLVFKSNAFETQLPLTSEQKQQIKSLEDQITVTRYLDTLFPE